MSATMTRAEIENELAELRTARLEVIKNREVQGSQGGRQVTKHSLSSLDHLNAHEKYLLGLLSRMDADGNRTGIRPRYGVFRG